MAPLLSSVLGEGISVVVVTLSRRTLIGKFACFSSHGKKKMLKLIESYGFALLSLILGIEFY